MSDEPHPPADRLRAFRLGGLSDREIDAVAEHLGHCTGCREALAAIPPPPALARAVGVGPRGAAARDPAPGFAVPGYTLLGELGRGGMGVVYRALQRRLDRVVALKTVLIDDPLARVRFRAEAEAVAAIHHPHVVRVHDAGEAGGHPFLVMEWLDGGTLAARLAPGVPLGPAEAAAVLGKVAAGVAAAHDAGIVHRDLKPANVLFTRPPDAPAPGPPGEPKVTDFGLAKRTASDLTETRAVMGSRGYMAPEQARGAKFVTPAADVWALGVILYECLTGARFSDAAPADGLSAPAPPRLWDRHAAVPKDLRLICQKCLEPDPADRYPTAQGLADDLARVVRGEPVSVRDPGLAERAAKWVRREPVRAAAYGLTGLTLALGGLVALVAALWVRAGRAEEATRGLNTRLVSDRGVGAVVRADPAAAVFHLTRALELAPADRPDQQRYLRTALASAHDSLHRLEDAFRLPVEVRAVAGSPDGRRLALVDANGVLRVHDLTTRRTREVLVRPPATVPPGPATAWSLAAVAFTPDGRSVVTAAHGGRVYVVDVATLRAVPLCAFPGTPYALSVSRVRNTVVVGGTEAAHPAAVSLEEYDLADGRKRPPHFAVGGRVDAVAFSPDGRFLATSGHRENCLKVWEGDKSSPAFVVPHPGPIFAITFSPDGSRVVTGCIDGGVRVWGTEKGHPAGPVLRHTHPVRALAYHPSAHGDLLLSGAEDGTARVWDVGLHAPVGQPLYHLGNVRGVTFGTTDGVTRFVTTGFDRVVRVWRLRPGAAVATLRHPAGVAAVAADPGGRYVLTGCRDAVGAKGGVRLWDQEGGRWVVRRTFRQDGEALAVGLGGGVVLGAGNDGHARLWGLDGAPDRDPLPHGPTREVVHSAAITRDGRYVAFAGRQRVIHLLDRTTGEYREWAGPDTGWVWTVTFAPDGSRLLTDGRSGARLWDVPTGRPLPAELRLAGEDEVRWSTFSPDGGRVLGCGFSKGKVGVWNADGNLLASFSGHQGQVYMGAFDPADPDAVATAGADHTVRVWSLKTWGPKFPPIAHDGKVLAVAYSPDGRELVTGCEDGTARIWSAADGAWTGPILRHEGAVTRVAYRRIAPGRWQVLTASADGTARVWTPPPPIDGPPAELRRRFMVESGMAPVEREPASAADPLRSGEGLLRVLEPEEWAALRDGT